jgi:hypothetical protein
MEFAGGLAQSTRSGFSGGKDRTREKHQITRHVTKPTETIMKTHPIGCSVATWLSMAVS